MTINIKINLDDYPQYSIEEFKNKTILGLDKKRFYQSESGVMTTAVTEGKQHYRMLAFMIFLHEATNSSVFKADKTGLGELVFGPSKGTPQYTAERINHWWATFFDYEITNNPQSLLSLSKEMLDYIDSPIVYFWNKGIESGLLSRIYNEKNINSFIDSCEYKPSKNKYGKVIFPIEQLQPLSQIKNTLNPFIATGLDFISKALNPHLVYKEKAENLKQHNKKVLENYAQLDDEEKITFAESFLKNNCYHKEYQELIENIKNLHILSQKYNPKDIEIKLEYEKILTKHLPVLLNFVDLHCGKKEDRIAEQICLVNDLVLKIHNRFQDEINIELNVKNRFLNSKNNSF